MIANSLKHRPPLGLIGGFATIRSGEHRNHIDMKMNGVVPVADLGPSMPCRRGWRWSTPARDWLRRGGGRDFGLGASDLVAAYDLIQTRRLDHQARRIQAWSWRRTTTLRPRTCPSSSAATCAMPSSSCAPCNRPLATERALG